MSKVIARLFCLAGAAIMAASTLAFYDTQILIDRALNSPTLTVRYSGVRAAMVELRLNGISLGTRNVSPAKASGETNFTLDLRALSDGDNVAEIRLYDRAGKLLASEQTIIANDDGSNAPVRMTYPKMGATVQGGVEIKIGFGREMKNVYVSFFVDDQFKAMTNAAPYTFVWDTTRETNGWHELEALVVDETSTTFKTRKVRVLVNNPGGRTERVLPSATEPAVVATTSSAPLPTKAPAKTSAPTGGAISGAVAHTVMPNLAAIIAANGVGAVSIERAGVKAGAPAPTQAAGPRVLTPTFGATEAPKVVAIPTTSAAPTTPPKLNIKTSAISGAVTATGLLSITKGRKLPELGALTISLDGKRLDFDVSPRVQQGVAIAPFRHIIEGNGGEVSWDNVKKAVSALNEGKTIRLRIGDPYASVGASTLELEIAPFLERGRTIVPLSFIRDALDVEVDLDPATGHVLITKKKG